MSALPPSRPEVLVREVLQGLAEGRYVPGQRLAEPDLMARTGLGRSTVREGLGRLAASGIVVQAPHRGAQIRHLTRRATCDVLRVTDPLLGLAARQRTWEVPGTVRSLPPFESRKHLPSRLARWQWLVETSLARSMWRMLPWVASRLSHSILVHARLAA